VSSEEFTFRDSLGDAVWKGEFDVLAEELFDVRTLDVVGLLDLDNPEDLRILAR